jgi:hypothetical protein
MRKTTLVIFAVLVLAGLLVARRPWARHRDPVAITFKGYWDWQRLDTNCHAGVQAQFVLTNLTAQRLITSEARARIQFKKGMAWRNYAGSNEVLRVDMSWIGPYGNTWFLRDFPREGVPWRLHVTYTVVPQHWTRLRLIEPLRSLLRLQDKQCDAWSQEIPGEPAR